LVSAVLVKRVSSVAFYITVLRVVAPYSKGDHVNIREYARLIFNLRIRALGILGRSWSKFSKDCIVIHCNIKYYFVIINYDELGNPDLDYNHFLSVSAMFELSVESRFRIQIQIQR